MRYLGMALNSKPYMGIGRNLAYRKHLFYDNKGFSNFLELYRGEDDLFINEVANEFNTRVESSSDAVIRVHSENYTHLDWKRDKVSYIVTSQFYKGSQRYVFGFETFTRLLFFASCIAALVIGILSQHWIVAGAAFLIWLVRYILQMVIVNRTSKDLGEKRRYYLSLLFFDLILPWQSISFKLSPYASKNNIRVNTSNSIHNAWS
jgi:hypothetical protein